MDRTTLRRLSEEPVQTVRATQARSWPRSLFSGRPDSNRSCKASCSLSPLAGCSPRLTHSKWQMNWLPRPMGPSGLSWEPASVSSLSSLPCDA